jgi:hypothetical protein
MPLLPSLYLSGNATRAWSVMRAAGYGAAIGAAAALIKTLGPLHAASGAHVGASAAVAASLPEILEATAAFAILCAAAAALRNAVARRLIWPDLP